METCIFCKIVAGELAAQIIYRDEGTLAFLSTLPDTPGHTLVIPTVHARNLLDASDDSLAGVIQTVKKMANALRASLGATGINVLTNNEPAGNQHVFHLHVHVIPRRIGDGLHYAEHGKPYKVGEAAEVAEKIRTALS